MKKLLSLAVYFCVATVIAEMIGVGVLLYNGTLNENSIKQLVAVVYGIEEDLLYQAEFGDLPEQTPLFDFQPAKDRKSTDRLKLTRREEIIDLALGDLLYIERQISDEKKEYEDLRQNFDDQFKRMQGVASNQSLVEVRETIQSMRPRQAADQIILMMQASEESTENTSANDAVTIIKTMPQNIRKKILAEFTDDQHVYLEKVISQIQSGVPEIPLIRQARNELSQLDKRFKAGQSSDPGSN